MFDVTDVKTGGTQNEYFERQRKTGIIALQVSLGSIAIIYDPAKLKHSPRQDHLKLLPLLR